MHNCHNGGMFARFGIVGDATDCCDTNTGGNTGGNTSTTYDDTEIRKLINNKVNTSTYVADKKTFALKTDIPDITDLATKTEVTTKDTELEQKITEETTRATKVETSLQNELDAKTKAVYHQQGIALKVNDFVIRANKIYLVIKAFTATDDFTADSANLYDLAESMSSSLGVVEYAAGITIKNGQQVIKDDKLYVCKADIDNTTDWTTDSANMIDFGANIDLSDYYNKSAVDVLLAQKMDLLTQGEGVNVTKVDNTITVSADMSSTPEADKIVQYGAEGIINANVPTTLTDTTVINNKHLTDELAKKQDAFTVGSGLSLANGELTISVANIQVVDTLPTNQVAGVVYLIKSTN